MLFDLGGVLIEIDFDRAFHFWEAHSQLTFDQIKALFAMDPAYEKHERGEIDGAAYFDHLRGKLKLDASDDEIRTGWNAIFTGAITETVNEILQIKNRFPCFMFSNSNPTHQMRWMADYPEIISVFDRIFVSSEIGLRKPERAAFDAISRATGVSLSAILFFDDMLENVEGACSAGLQAVQVRSPIDVKQALAGI